VTRPEQCGCPGGGSAGGRARISSTGWCQRCGAQGSHRAEAIRAALAARNWGPATEAARAAWFATGFAAGVQVGRREVIDCLTGPGGLLDMRVGRLPWRAR
jgi:hypothetical protein